jgi:hypothetical protein
MKHQKLTGEFPTAPETRLGKRRRYSHIFPKQKLGWYVEPRWIYERLFAVERFAPGILDPMCGAGAVLYAAKARGYHVHGRDVVNRLPAAAPWPFHVRDFFAEKWRAPWAVMEFSIVSNPSFEHVEAFCRRACELAGKVAVIMPLRRLPAAHWLAALPLQTIYLLSPRPSMPTGEYLLAGNKPGNGKQDFCVLVFDRSHRGPPQVKWLYRDGMPPRRSRQR